MPLQAVAAKTRRPSIAAHPVRGGIGAVVTGVDIGLPMDDATFAEIRRIWLEHPVIAFRNVDWTPERQIEFSKRFGPLEEIYLQYATLPGYAEIFVISTIPDREGKVHVPRVGRHWHTDSQFLENPISATILYAKVVPPVGGDTEFIDMYEVYAALPDALRRRIQGVRAVYDRPRHQKLEHPDWPEMTEEEKRRMPPIAHPIVRTHPETGRKALYISAMQGTTVEGMGEDEGTALLKELMDFAGQPRFIRAYHWQAGDVMLWDNRCLLHRSTDFDTVKYHRRMLRTAVVGDVPA